MKKLLIVLILFFSYASYSQTAEEYFDIAYDKAENGDYYGAIADYNKAIELDPDNGGAYYNRGWSKNKLKEFVDCYNYEENSLFQINKDFTMFSHTTEGMKSSYYINSSKYNETMKSYEFEVVSDVGNKYTFFFSEENKRVSIMGGVEDDKLYIINFKVKAIF